MCRIVENAPSVSLIFSAKYSSHLLSLVFSALTLTFQFVPIYYVDEAILKGFSHKIETGRKWLGWIAIKSNYLLTLSAASLTLI
jgi:hypothetical protein